MIMQSVAILSVLAIIALLLIEAFSKPAIPQGQVQADYITDKRQAVLAYGRAVKTCRQMWSSYIFCVGKCPKRERMAFERYNRARQRMHQVRANCYDLGIAIK